MRSLTPAMIAELQAGTIRPAIFVEVNFVCGPAYMWTGYGSITWNGHTWSGVGHLGSISPISEVGEVAATNLTLSLSGIPTALIGQALNECRPNAAAKVWLALCDSSGNVIPDPA